MEFHVGGWLCKQLNNVIVKLPHKPLSAIYFCPRLPFKKAKEKVFLFFSFFKVFLCLQHRNCCRDGQPDKKKYYGQEKGRKKDKKNGGAEQSSGGIPTSCVAKQKQAKGSLFRVTMRNVESTAFFSFFLSACNKNHYFSSQWNAVEKFQAHFFLWQ